MGESEEGRGMKKRMEDEVVEASLSLSGNCCQSCGWQMQQGHSQQGDERRGRMDRCKIQKKLL